MRFRTYVPHFGLSSKEKKALHPSAALFHCDPKSAPLRLFRVGGSGQETQCVAVGVSELAHLS